MIGFAAKSTAFQLTAARRRLDDTPQSVGGTMDVSTHSRPKAAGLLVVIYLIPLRVSTHSRPKAAGKIWCLQPRPKLFQLTAARRRLAFPHGAAICRYAVSTHSRPKAAGPAGRAVPPYIQVSTHSRPKAAGPSIDSEPTPFVVSTHSRPKAAGCGRRHPYQTGTVSTHSRPKAAGR